MLKNGLSFELLRFSCTILNEKSMTPSVFQSPNIIACTFFRAVTYGLWSLLVPAGYNTDPAAFIGYTKLPLFPDIPDSGPDDSCMPATNEPPSEKDLARY